MRRLALQLMVGALAVALMGAAVWFVALHARHGSCSFRCGMLATNNDPYLDGSGSAFQSCAWHLGNGTRTWGETYGIKVRRVYVSMEVTHTNPRLTRSEAREDE